MPKLLPILHPPLFAEYTLTLQTCAQEAEYAQQLASIAAGPELDEEEQADLARIRKRKKAIVAEHRRARFLIVMPYTCSCGIE